MIGEPLGAKKSGFFPCMRNENDGTRRLFRRKLLGDLEQYHRAGSVVVGTIHD